MKTLITLIAASCPGAHDKILRIALALLFLVSLSVTPALSGQPTPPSAAATAPVVRLTILGDNAVAQGGVKAVWGFACLVGAHGHTVLFDTGSDPDVLKDNLAAMKVDPAKIETVVISHWHPDHTWGVPGLGKLAGVRALTPRGLEDFATLRSAGVKEDVARSIADWMAKETAKLTSAGLELVAVSQATPVFDGIAVSEPLPFGQIPTDKPGRESTYPFWEQCLTVDTPEGLVVIVGCSHPGIVPILEQVKRQTGRPLHMVIGGFHLLEEPEDAVRRIATAMQAMGVAHVSATHCTGEAAAHVFRDVFGDRCVSAGVGAVIDLPLAATGEGSAQQPKPTANPGPETARARSNQPASAPRAAALSPEQRQWLAKGERHEKAGWTYLHIEGGPRERGFQHGYLLAKEIAECLRIRRAVWLHNTSMEWAELLKETARFMTPFIDPENREELAGIVDGLQAAGVAATLDDLVAYNAYMELEWYWWPEVNKKLSGGATVVTPPKQSCSSFIATGSMTRDGGVVLAHNSMTDYAEAYFNVVIDIVPAQGHHMLMQTAPGWIHSGTDFFITDAGLVGSETTIGGFHGYTEWGIPEFVRMRRATQDAANIDEWCEIMKKGNTGGYANAWLLGDVNTREIARLELGLMNVGFERTRDGFFIGSNVAENLKILRRETEMNESDIRTSSIARRVRWKQLMAQHRGKIDATLAREFEADHFDVYAKAERPGGRTLCGHWENETEYAPGWWSVPFDHWGTLDAKVVDTAMAKRMSFAARWGSACGRAFDAKKYLQDHGQFDWLEGLLKDLPAEPWVEFTAGEKP